MMSNPEFDAVVVGNVGIDTNIYLTGNQLDLAVEGHFTENLDTIGQAGGFSARGFARLGWRTAFLGSVGDDLAGDFIRSEFAADGIDTGGIFIDPAGTARSANLVFPDGSRRSFYDGKGHLDLVADADQSEKLFRKSKLAHFSIPNWARRLLSVARGAGTTISCDLQDIPHPEDPYRQDFIRWADILFFSSSNLSSPESLMEPILAQFPEKILVSGLGAAGCALGTGEGVRYFPAVEIGRPVVDTNGAGDSLAVGFLSAYVLEGRTLEEAVRQGQIAARYTCSLKGGSSHLITREDLQAYFREFD